jgi:TorA maturation chaperone TorD
MIAYICSPIVCCIDSVLPLELRPYASLYGTPTGYPYSDPLQLVSDFIHSSGILAVSLIIADLLGVELCSARWRSYQQLSHSPQSTVTIWLRSNIPSCTSAFSATFNSHATNTVTPTFAQHSRIVRRARWDPISFERY